MTVQFEESRTALNTLQLIRDCIDEGVQDRLVQTTPHLVLLNKAFYDQKLKPLLAQWMIVWLNAKETIPMNNEKLQEYILVGKKASEDVLKLVKTKLTDAAIKMVNLSHEWLTSILPFVLGKIDRVSFGLLSKADMKLMKESGLYLSPNRIRLAVPFIGKDVPSRSSEFAHPDVKIGLTICAYRLEGLRMNDFKELLKSVLDSMREEYGPVMQRKSSKLWIKWVHETGRVCVDTTNRGSKKRN